MTTALRRTALAAALPVLATCALAACGGTSSDRQTSRAMVRLGDRMLESGELDSAAGFYRGAGERDPTDPEPRLRLATILARQGDQDGATRGYLEVVAADPSNAEARVAAAAGLLRRGTPAAAQLAEETLAPVAGPGSRSARALRLRGVALDLLGRQGDAAEAYRRGIALAPADPDLRANLALSLAVAGQADAAVEEARRAVAVPGSGDAHRGNLVLVLAMAGRAAEAGVEARTLPAGEAENVLAQGRRAAAAPDAASRAVILGVSRGRGA
ncbi:tetratricopeptide repeat protein [Roseomonas sp. CCTCC AB2023176]|uniref:tetratricopeptide repeat protein n=1 Tax=Roseomonas sp. CCTCC AB2023176 TaxID=3342640 RepID=UPI0035E251B6